MFDVYYIGSNKQLQDHLPFAKQIDSVNIISPKTKMYWLVEPNIEVKDYNVFNFRPDDHDQIYEHVWKWNTNNYGGLKLLPRNSSKGVKQIDKVVCKKAFEILNTKTPEKYFDKNPYATHVWCVDPEYKIAEDINWAPDNFEPDFIHSFHLRGQLEHKYPAEEGGVKLYPCKWKDADIKYHSFLDASAKYPVLFVSDPEDYSQRDTFSDEYVWLIDKEYKIDIESLDWVPNPFEETYIHSFRMPNQLQEKSWSYKHHVTDKRLGGIRLVPKEWKSATKGHLGGGVIIHTDCPIDDLAYNVFYINDDEFNSDTYRELAERSKTKWFWVVDREYDFNGKLSFIPAEHEQEYIHVFKVPGMLEERYPLDFIEPWDNRCGGVRLVNRNFDITKHKYQQGIVPVKYDIFYTDDPKNNFATFARKSKTKMFWLIDSEYLLDNDFKVVVPKHEQQFILNFQADQLQHKYPEQEGGIYLIPNSFNDKTQIKYKGIISKKLRRYPILRVSDVEDLSQVTEDCWVIDEEYQLADTFNWVPSTFQKHSIHTFHVGEQLRHKYPDAMGGMRWVPLDWDGNYVIHNDDVSTQKGYPVLFVADPSDFSQVTEDCWLVDKEYEIESTISFLPWGSWDDKWKADIESKLIHNYHVKGQLEHKYPEAMGGVYWVPKNWADAETKIHDTTPFGNTLQFDIFDNEETGRRESTTGWFWVIDPDVDLLPDFDLSYVPKVWDKGKAHVWQKLNPITERQYDYSGVMLCPKEPLEKGRPKYMRTAACKQREYPVYYLGSDDYKKPLYDAYVRFSTATETAMFWVVDAYTQIDSDFKFDYYPTQWDKHCIHVFLNEDGEHKNVRLIPKTLFEEWEYSDEEIANNTFNDLKLINTVASLRPSWPIITLDTFNRDYFISELESYRDGFETGKSEPFVWTVDPHVNTNIKNSPIKEGFLPKITDVNKIHCWQKVNDITGQVHGYGGLRLWPTNGDYSKLTSDALKLNKIRNVQYVKKEGCISNTFDVVFLSYKESDAERSFEKLKDKICEISTTSAKQINLIWVKDIEGIFNAHKQAAQQVTSKMFWVVDADAEITNDFNFGYVPDAYDEEVVHVWNSRNPVNGLVYGYGGVKLLPTSLVKDATSWGLDFTTGLSNRFKSIAEVACTTRFNTDAYSTWRSAFRECVKLALKDDAESKQRLEGWLHPVPDADFRHEAERGAEEGKAFALKHKDNLTELNNINNFDWLYEQYTGNNKS